MLFLSPGLLAALLPLVALPLILHLLNRGFPQQLKFPTVELIRKTMARRSRVHRWRHWILLLLRTIFLLLLLLAFLLPVRKKFGANPAEPGRREVLIVLDHSASMEHKGDGPTAGARAVHQASGLMDSLDPADGVNVLLMDPSLGTCFTSPSKDHAEAKRFVSRQKSGFGRGDVNGAIAVASRLVSRAEQGAELYFISDFQRKNWANANFTSLPASVRLFFIDVGAKRRDNRAVLGARLAATQILAGDTVALEVELGNYSDAPFSGRVTVVLDGQYRFDQEAALAPWASGQVYVPVAAGGPGLHRCEVKIPEDALEHDNHHFLTLNVLEKEEILIVTDAPEGPKRAAYFLQAALNPFENEAGSLLPRVIASRELTPSRLAGVHKLILAQIGRLSEESCAAMKPYLFHGGGALYFLDGTVDAINLGLMEKAFAPDAMPLRIARRQTATNVASGAQQVVRGDFKSRYLKLFEGSARQNLALLEFYDYYQAGATGAGEVLMAYADESPALAAAHHGLGTMLLLNFSAAPTSSNLARQRLFPAWMQELVKAISSDELPPSSHRIGELLQTELWRADMDGENVVAPAGSPVRVKKDLTGERYAVTFTPDQLGFYTLGGPRPKYAWAVNTGPDESDLRPIDQAVLPTEFAGPRPAHFVGGREEFEELAKGQSLVHWFLLASLAFLVMETGFQWLWRRRTT